MTRIIEQYNDKLAKNYDRATSKGFKWKAAKEATKILLPKLKKRSKILDLGVGTGQSSEKFYHKDHHIIGVDISLEMLQIARKKYPKIKTYKCDIERGLDKLNFKKRSFDSVLAIGILEFIKNLKPLLKNVSNLIAREGYLCIAFEEFISGHKIQGKRVSVLGEGLVDKTPRLLSFKVYRRTENEIVKLLADNKILINKRLIGYLRGPKKNPVVYRIILAQVK